MNRTTRLDTMDILLYQAMPYVRSRELEQYEQVASSEMTLSNWANRKILRRIRKTAQYFENHAEYRPMRENCKRAVFIVLLIMSLCFGGGLTVEAVRTSIWEAFVEWYEESIFFSYVESEEVVEVPSTILEYKEPLLPEKYSRFEIIKNSYMFSVEYECDGGAVVYEQNILAYYETLLSNYQTVMESVYVNNHLGYRTKFVSNNVTETIYIWNDGKYVYLISGNVNEKEMLKYAESIE